MDGANLNAILGRFKPGEAGFDVMHFNVHKTFSTPHGGGGPGAGPVGVGETLIPYLPAPRVLRDDDGTFRLERPGERPTSIGRLRSFVGNTGVLVRAYAYIRAHGGTGLREVSDDAVLAANYLQVTGWPRPTTSRTTAPCKHEFVASAATIKKRTGVRTLDIAKRLIDYGYHPPTIYFPLIVEEGMLIEPTETESVETLDAFADALIAIAAEADDDAGARHERPAHGAGPAPRRGDGGPPAEPPLASDDRRGDAVPRLNSTSIVAKRTLVRLEVDSRANAVDSTGSAPTRSVLPLLLAHRPFRAGGSTWRPGETTATLKWRGPGRGSGRSSGKSPVRRRIHAETTLWHPGQHRRHRGGMRRCHHLVGAVRAGGSTAPGQSAAPVEISRPPSVVRPRRRPGPQDRPRPGAPDPRPEQGAGLDLDRRPPRPEPRPCLLRQGPQGRAGAGARPCRPSRPTRRP